MKISIIVPCFNEMSNLEVLSERIKRSLEKNNIVFEVILVDDGSQDKTWETIERILANQTKFIGIKNVRNLGIYESWKTGITISTGD
jgi:glycosyltransferase involved in cell wall biosynthesis